MAILKRQEINSETYKLGPGPLAGAEITICMEPQPGAGRVRVVGTVMHLTRSATFSAGELATLRDQIDAALDGLA